MPLGAFKAALMGTAGVTTGDVVLISSQTASTSATVAFTSGISSTYGEYIFKFYNIHPGTDNVDLQFQANASGESGYNETITSTYFRADHNESDYSTAFQYFNLDQQQGTAYQGIIQDVGSDNDQTCAGELHLFNPASTTYVKHFYSKMNGSSAADETKNHFVAGYINTTSAITQVSFKFESGNIDAGTIKMWGVK